MANDVWSALVKGALGFAQSRAGALTQTSSELSVACSETDTLHGLLVPPTVRGTLQGWRLEEVRFLRDETTNVYGSAIRSEPKP
jgi:hypothetical protein